MSKASQRKISAVSRGKLLRREFETIFANVDQKVVEKFSPRFNEYTGKLRQYFNRGFKADPYVKKKKTFDKIKTKLPVRSNKQKNFERNKRQRLLKLYA